MCIARETPERAHDAQIRAYFCISFSRHARCSSGVAMKYAAAFVMCSVLGLAGWGGKISPTFQAVTTFGQPAVWSAAPTFDLGFNASKAAYVYASDEALQVQNGADVSFERKLKLYVRMPFAPTKKDGELAASTGEFTIGLSTASAHEAVPAPIGPGVYTTKLELRGWKQECTANTSSTVAVTTPAAPDATVTITSRTATHVAGTIDLGSGRTFAFNVPFHDPGVEQQLCELE